VRMPTSIRRQGDLLARSVAVAAATLIGAMRPAMAQTTVARDGIVLRLHPRVGDTLRTRLEQLTEITIARPGTSPRPMATTVTVLTRTIVQASRQASTTVLTVVDSADVRTSDPRVGAMAAQAERSLRGQQLVLELAEDGTVEIAREARGLAVSRDVTEAMASMPAVFPHRSVAIGERWQREMPLVSSNPLGGAGANAHVRAEFRLDSLGRHGELAFVSMRGEIVPDGDRPGPDLSGRMTGEMQVDRRRGWMTDSRFTLVVVSLVAAPGAAAAAPTRFLTKVTQRLRTMDKW
jgi:hypothetical protein